MNISIPFSNTNEAIVFGQNMNEAMKDELANKQKMFMEMFEEYMEEEKWQDASDIALNSQLCRESIEAFNGELTCDGYKS